MRIALTVAYNGASFIGWQKQKLDTNSIQHYMVQACSHVAGHEVAVYCAGRTDARVHATQQFVHFETNSIRRDEQWLSGVNSKLPKTIKVNAVKRVTNEFHARFSAVARHYCYVIDTNTVSNPLAGDLLTWCPRPLNLQLMQQAAIHLEGKQDFSSFRSSQCQANTAVRRVEFVKLYQQDRYIVIEIKANAFLHHMVRNIVGALLEIGERKKSPDWMKQLLECKNRSEAGVTAPAEGLYLIGVDYPEIKSDPAFPFFLNNQ